MTESNNIILFLTMSSQYKRKIKIVTINEKFFELFNDGSDNELLLIRKDMHRRPCLIVVKIKFNGKTYDFALPFRSNINPSTPKDTFYNLPPRKTTKPKHYHGIHYAKAFPIDEKYFENYSYGGDFLEELILAKVEKEIKVIIDEFKKYLQKYENGEKVLYCVNLENAINKQNL